MAPNGFMRLAAVLALILASSGPRLAIADECDERYFSPEDQDQSYPLARASVEFARTLRMAKSGDVRAQSSLAASYESGYLVSRCRDKAAFWYGKAAASGDADARKWVGNYEVLEALRNGPECAGPHCGIEAGPTYVAVLYANGNRNNHYFAPVTINGHTVEGMIDTGASVLAMSIETAKQLGLDASEGKLGKGTTANGQVTTVNVILPLVDVAGIKLHNVRASVGITGTMLIGMSFLSRLDMAMASGKLTLALRE